MDNTEEFLLFQEVENEALFELDKGVLEENGIRCRYTQRVVGVRNVRRHYQIFVHKDDLENARAALTNDIFSDIPWDSDSENPDPNPEYPWYMDRNRYVKIARRIFVLVWVILIMLIVWSCK